MSKLTALVHSLPRVPEKMPGGVEILGVVRGTGILLGRWGDGFMLIRTEAAAGGWLERPLTPILTRDEIRAIVEDGVLAIDRRVLTWPPLTNVLALGVLLAEVPPAELGPSATPLDPSPPLPGAEAHA